MLGLLRQAVDEFGQTVIMVTHEPHAASVADRIVVLRDGEVVHDGAGQDEEGVLDLMKAKRDRPWQPGPVTRVAQGPPKG